MALDFTNASLLGYNVANEFLGEAGLNHRKVISLNVECFIDEGKKAGNLDGVSENFAKIREQIVGGDDYWDSNIIINGKNFGKGRVLSLDFATSPGTLTSNIRLGKWTASLEIYRVGDVLSRGALGFHETFAQYVNGWTETLDFSKDSDGSTTANWSATVDLMSGDYGNTKDNPIRIAKSMVGMAPGNFQNRNSVEFLLDAFDSSILGAGVGANFSEDYDLINYNFSFSSKWKVLPEGNIPNYGSNSPSMTEYDYMAKTNRSIASANGVITVTEKGDVESFAGDWFDMTGGMESQIDTAHARCTTLFEDATHLYDTWPSVAGHYPLNSTALTVSRQYDSGAGVGSYSVSFSNMSGIGAYFTHEYTQSISRDSAGISQVSENGSIGTRRWKAPYWSTEKFPTLNPPQTSGPTALTEANIRMIDAAYHAKEFYDNFKGRLGETPAPLNQTSSKITFPKYGKVIKYSKAYADDPTIYPDNHPSKLKKVNVTINDVAPMPIIKPYTIPHRGAKGEVLHEPGQTTAGSRSVSVSAMKARECYYSNLTGDASNVLPDWTTANNYILNNVIIPQVNLSPSQINSYILDMYVDGMSASMSSEGDMSMNVDLSYTAARVQPSTFNSNSSNYNV